MIIPGLFAPAVIGRRDPVSFTTAWRFPSSNSVITSNENSWINPTNVYADDGSFMVASGNQWSNSKSSDLIHFGGFGFSSDFSSGATLLGIEVEFEFDVVPAVSSSALDYNFQLSKSAVLLDSAGNQKTALGWPFEIVTLGDVDDMWSSSLTAAEARASTFGVRFSVRKDDPEVTLTSQVDYIKMRIHGEA